MTKKQVLSAIGSVIYNYENNINRHTLNDCPLCCALYTVGCTKCPNYPFQSQYIGIHSSGVPCFKRGLVYIKLNYEYEWNNEHLAKFWTLVLEMLKKESAKDVIRLTPKVQEKILAIAETFKND